jgi:UDP-N-acetylglucosamine 2-epimerase (non-hydrolysing)
MPTPLRLLVVAGARPNFMKIAPLIHAVRAHNDSVTHPGKGRTIQCQLVHTGQHYDEKMSEVFFRELGIPKPEFNLEVGSGSHAVQTAAIMTRFEPILLEQRPDWVVVVGDVNSTLACTLVASKLGIKVAHVEAGLRSGDRTMPEEINRLVTDAIADLLLTPSEDGSENLRREGVAEHKIRLVGNIMIDALVANLPKARESRILEQLQVKAGEFAYVTLHRPANVDSPATLLPIMAALNSLANRLPVVFPIHPRTRKTLASHQPSPASNPAIHLIDPVGYHDSLHLSETARLIVTDSGGLQEESTYFRTPCLTLRPNTERPVTVSVGSNRLTSIVGLDAAIQETLQLPPRIGQVPALWDGQTAGRVLAVLLES